MTGSLAVSTDREDDMPSTKTAAKPETPAQPVFERLPVDPFVPCDGHASQAIQALVTMLTPSGAEVYLCGHHARKAGFEHTKDAPQENRQKGSDH